MNWEKKLKQVELLVNRLDRLSSDSIWAHRASGIRGSLLEVKDQLASRNWAVSEELDNILDQGYFVLGQAAKNYLTKNLIKVANPDDANKLGKRNIENDIHLSDGDCIDYLGH
jgi:hypothetical protein